MSDINNGVGVIDDDFNPAAAPGAREAAGARAAAWGGKGLTVAIGVSAALAVLVIVLWVIQLSGGMVQTGMRNLDS